MNVCQFCKREFNKAEHLQRHQRSHTGEKPFQCQECGRRYGRSDVLLRHMKHMHKGSSVNGSSNASDHGQASTAAVADGNTSPKKSSGSSAMSLAQTGRHSISSIPSPSPLGAARPHTSTDQLDTLATASMLLSRDEIPGVVSRNPVLSQEEMARSWSKDVHEGDVPIADDVLEKSPPRAITDFSFMEVDSAAHVTSMLPPPRQQVPGDIFFHQDGQVTADILDFLHNNSNTDILNMMSDFSLPFPVSPSTNRLESSSQDRMSNVPDERFDLVSRIWPNRLDLSASNSATFNVWTDLVSSVREISTGDGIMSNSCISFGTRSQSLEWIIDDIRQQGMWQDIDPSTFVQQSGDQSHNTGSGRGCFVAENGSDGGDSATSNTGFPSTRLLNLGLAIAFRQPVYLVSFIHQSTFRSRKTSNLFLFSLCLLGLILLDADRTKRHVHTYLPIAIKKCCARLAEPELRRGSSRRLISDIGSATLLLGAISLCPDLWNQERIMAQMLYQQTFTIAQMTGFFEPRPSTTTSSDLLHWLHGESNVVGDVESQGTRWRRWAQFEELKRLTSVLIVIDAWWACRLVRAPLISTHAIQYELPCSTELFKSTTAQAWARLIEKGDRAQNQLVAISLHAPWPTLTGAKNLPPLGVMGLLSIAWIHILEIRCRIIPWSPMNVVNLEGYMIPIRIYQLTHKPGGMSFENCLEQIYTAYPDFLRHENPSCISMWHHLNIQLLVNVEVLEIAAGRDTVEEAHAALRIIASWSKTQAARRACLHAAGVYAAMSRRRTHHGLMLHSEASMFVAALVLALYVFMVPQSEDVHDEQASPKDSPMESFEILDELDWRTIGLQGYESWDLNETALPENTGSERAPNRFIRQSPHFNFMGTTCNGSYECARMILLEFAHLMEDIGKGREGLSRVLRAMSDSLVDMEVDI
ncbi:hypothetical protein NLU13_3645 [Sarocladium strictum]|uniref:C2H2-type domain-containing protein n=1 Tax=Sarocladium strictum TaxID=5046 RepID=A0AA39GQ56_SARSR|nr:hypothetical protein NLU13_3645 [Sarocladium strictum]